MQINWKQLAQSPGYKSLKAAYIKDVQESERDKARFGRAMRDKEELLRKFTWVIHRAKHYASRQGRSIEDVLNEWEAGRDYWWFSYYQDCKQPKLPSGKPANVKNQSSLTCLRKNFRMRKKKDKKELFDDIRDIRMRSAKNRRERLLNKKPRWSTERKTSEKRIRQYRKQQSL